MNPILALASRYRRAAELQGDTRYLEVAARLDDLYRSLPPLEGHGSPVEPPELPDVCGVGQPTERPATANPDCSAAVKRRCLALESAATPEQVASARFKTRIAMASNIVTSKYGYEKVRAYEKALMLTVSNL